MKNLDYNINIDKKSGVAVVIFSGSIDINNKDKILQIVKNRLVPENKQFVLFDLNNLQYIDSSGLGIFLTARSILDKHNGDLGLVVTDKNIKKILNLAGFNKIFKIFDTSREGCRKLK